MFPHLFARDADGSIALRIPHHEVAPLLAVLRRDFLDLDRVALPGFQRVVGDDLARPQQLACVRANQQRQIGQLLHEFAVVGAVAEQDVRHAQQQRRVGPRSDRHPVVGLRRGRAVLRRDVHHLPAALQHLNPPVRVSHLVLDHVLAHKDEQLGVPEVVQIRIKGLNAGHHGMARRQVAVPVVVRPRAAAYRLPLVSSRLFLVEQRDRVGEAIQRADLRDARQPHPRAALHHPRPGPVHRLDHLRRIALRAQPPRTRLPLVFPHDVQQRLRHQPLRLVPTGAHPAVGAPMEVLSRRQAVGLLREAGFHPLLETLAHHWMLHAIGAVDAPHQRVPLQAAPRVPCPRHPVAIHVFRAVRVVVLLGADDDAVAHECPQPAVVGIVGCADKRKRAVVAILVAVHLLPVSRRIVLQRIADLLDRSQQPQRRRKNRRAGKRRFAGQFKEMSPGMVGHDTLRPCFSPDLAAIDAEGIRAHASGPSCVASRRPPSREASVVSSSSRCIPARRGNHCSWRGHGLSVEQARSPSTHRSAGAAPSMAWTTDHSVINSGERPNSSPPLGPRNARTSPARISRPIILAR